MQSECSFLCKRHEVVGNVWIFYDWFEPVTQYVGGFMLFVQRKKRMESSLLCLYIIMEIFRWWKKSFPLCSKQRVVTQIHHAPFVESLLYYNNTENFEKTAILLPPFYFYCFILCFEYYCFRFDSFTYNIIL